VKKTVTAGAWAALVAAWVLTAQNPAAPVIDNALQALGSRDLKTMQFSGSGAEFCLGQQYSATSGYPKFLLGDYVRTVDMATQSSRQTARRSQGEPVQGGCGAPIQPGNQNTFIAPNAAWAQKLDVLLTPQGFLSYAAAHNPSLASKKVANKQMNVVSFKEGKYTMNGYIDAQTNFLERIETWLDNPVLGDMLVEAKFMDYRDFTGMKFPARMVQSRGGFPVLDLTITGAKANVEASALQPPAAKGGGKGGVPKGGGPPALAANEPQKLGEGVWLIPGGYQSVVIEFKDYVAIWEAASDAVTTQTIAQARKLVPSKPIRYAILSHAHSDHTGGIGIAVAEGLTLMAHKNAKAYLEPALAAPRTLLEGDKMAASGKKPKWEVVGDKKILKNGDMVVELYNVSGTIHDDGNMIMYFPKLKLMVNSDVYNYSAPTADVHPWHANLWENLERLKIDIDRVIPTHGPPGGRAVSIADIRASAHK
jgi:glyoxylase-like metal-dependent hydrolase (beta-lactamase superfamily II)